jgi:hypothetical protein
LLLDFTAMDGASRGFGKKYETGAMTRASTSPHGLITHVHHDGVPEDTGEERIEREHAPRSDRSGIG